MWKGLRYNQGKNMARFDYRKLSEKERDELVGELAVVMAGINKKEDLQKFFLQLVTPSEAIMLGRRWQIAKRLAADMSYYSIAQELKVGMSTITAVDQWLSDAIGDYRGKVQEERARAEKQRRGKKFESFDMVDSFSSIRHRFGLPFLLINLLVDGFTLARWSRIQQRNNGKR
jgi:uncharacterized protein YerC